MGITVLKGLQGTGYTLGGMIKEGGEGAVYRVSNRSDILIKLYKPELLQQKPHLQQKLKYMVSRPIRTHLNNAIAWPLDALYNKGAFAGFAMPRLSFDNKLDAAYDYDPKRMTAAKSRVNLASNLCRLVIELHRKSLIIGDFNHENVGYQEQNGHVCMMDVDSFHMVNSGFDYRCGVCMPGYLAPEIIKHCRLDSRHTLDRTALPTFTQNSDNFALAVHIFRMLMNGISPFNGVKTKVTGSTEAALTGNGAIERNQYCFRPDLKSKNVLCPPKIILPHEIIALFDRAFIEGRDYPFRRPTAREWLDALQRYANALVPCSKQGKIHQYDRHLSKCPWCEADARQKARSSRFFVPAYTVTRTDTASRQVHSKANHQAPQTKIAYLQDLLRQKALTT
ncbi:MAG: hypothetical protein LBT44_08860 [Clostridiales bacterium]|jgi:DNA-binding helix-hairpin-helix protein with protein kinase domain|nr:hypothetical protein [Clostridiales bacterium]